MGDAAGSSWLERHGIHVLLALFVAAGLLLVGNNPFCHHRALETDKQGLRERIEFVEKAPDIAFGTALFRVVREHKDEAARADGPVAVEGPRSSRLESWSGPGKPL